MRLNDESLNILYSILYSVRKDYPNIKFMWIYNYLLGDYVLLYSTQEEINNYNFEKEVFDKYCFSEKVTRFIDINTKYLSIEKDFNNKIEDNVDIVETEILVNTYKLKKDLN